MPRNDPRIDRLVTGELTPEERRALIRELESEPEGWKDLATAFLEAQCWRESFTEIPRASREPKWMRRGVAASVIALAFGLGWSARTVPPTDLAESTMLAPTEELLTAANLSTDRDDFPPPRHQPVTEYDLHRLERLGYQVGVRRRLIAVPGEGGATVAVPVNEVEVRYVGGPPA